jgi:hypothetical protein
MANKDDFARFVEIMNAHLGTKHRSVPYNFSNPDDIKQAMVLAIGAYRDYERYCAVLFGLIENFDESVENYETDTWFYSTHDPEKADDLTMQCYDSLKDAIDMFTLAEERAKDNLISGLKMVLSAPQSIQTSVFGIAFDIKSEELSDNIDDLLESFSEVDYCYAIPESFKSFVSHMRYVWAGYLV